MRDPRRDRPFDFSGEANRIILLEQEIPNNGADSQKGDFSSASLSFSIYFKSLSSEHA
jgi:hypothetical protein